MSRRPSTVARLPPAVREEISRLRESGRTIDEIMGHLRLMDVRTVSRSAMGRYVQRLDAAGERLRRTRMITEGLKSKLAETPESQLTSVNVELLQSWIYDFLSSADDEGEDGDAAKKVLRDPKNLAKWSEAVERLTKASRHNLEFVARAEQRAADRARKAALDQAAAEAERGARQAGLSAEAASALRRSVLGLRAKAPTA